MTATGATATAEALVWTDRWVLERREVPLPDLAPEAMLVRVDSTGICGTDRHLISARPPFPTILGHEIAGTVVDIGSSATGRDSSDRPVAMGDRIAIFPWIPCLTCWACRRFGPAAATCSHGFVYGIPFILTGSGGDALFDSRIDQHPGLTGGLAEYLYVFPGTYFWRIPDDMPSAVAALLDPLAVAVRSVDMARTSTGTWDEVLTPDAVAVVLGAGPIGLLAAMVLRTTGVGTVVVIGSRRARLGAADAMGADVVLDITDGTFDDRDAQVRRMTSGRGADLVVDCANTAGALAESLQLVRRLGTVIEVGNMLNVGEMISIDPARDICQMNIRLLGMSANPPRSYTEGMALLAQHKRFPFERLISHELPRHRAQEAIAQLLDPDVIKVVLHRD